MLHSLVSSAAAALSIASFAYLAAFGPPRITVREVTDRTTAPTGAVLLVEGRHHADSDPLTITGRAEGMRDGKRVTVTLTLANAGGGRYGVTRQWAAGSPWLLILSAGEGNNGAHGVAEALVRIGGNGAVLGIEYPAPGWIGQSNTPKRTTEREIEATLATMQRTAVTPSR